MSNRLTIGAMSLGAGWRILLDQLGVTYERVTRWDAISPESHSAIIVNAQPDDEALAAIERYLDGGGGVLDVGKFLPRIDRRNVSIRHLGSLPPDPGDPLFRDVGMLDLHISAPLHREARHLSGSVHLTGHGAGRIAYLPFDPERLLTSTGATRTSFHVEGGRMPNEIVARVSKGPIRRAFEVALRWLHVERGLPYIHRWHFPHELESLFCYRIDSDYGTRRQVTELYEAAREHATRLTWFLHVEAHHDWLDLFGRFEGHEIAAHGYRHRTFGSYEENRANIEAATALLDGAGLHPDGFAAPNGFWNVPLQRAIDDTGMLYSSEFSLAYDDLPFHPPLHGRPARALQIPTHPICIGSFLRVKMRAEGMKRYFREVIDLKLQQREPAVLYHHPGHEHFDVMADSFAHARALGMANLTMGEYARWWRQRDKVRFDARWDGRSVELSFRAHDPAVRLALHRSQDEYALLAGEGTIQIDGLRWRRRIDRGAAIPAEAIRARGFSLTALRHSIEDYNARARQ